MKFLANLRSRVAKTALGRAAITLVELTLVLALAAIVVFVAVRAYSNAQENSRVQQTASAVGQVRSVVESLAQGQANYAFLGTDAAGTLAPSLPASMSSTSGNTTTLSQPFGALTVAQNGNEYTISAAALPADACQRLAVMDMGRSVTAVKAGTTELTLPASPSEAATACATGGAVAWTFQ